MMTHGARASLYGLFALIVCTALLTPASAQEEQLGPTPFVYLLRGELDPGMMSEYTDAVEKVVAASRDHENGQQWAAYATLTGGNSPRFQYFLPMQKIGDMDGWTPMFQLLTEAYGRDTAVELSTTLSECWTPSSLILGYMPMVSNPREVPPTGPPPFAWHLRVGVEPGMVFEYISLVQTIVEAHKSHERGMNWIAYSNVVGGEGSEFHYFIAMDKLGEMDEWPLSPQVMIESVGEEEWKRMQKRFTEISTGQSEILVLSPTHSNLQAPPDADG
jgi:hypothetical protein